MSTASTTFNPSALYLLDRENVPQQLVDQCIARARAGELITHSDMLRVCRAWNVRLAPRRRPLERVTVRIKNAATLTRSLDRLGVVLRDSASRMTRDEREALAEQFLKLALELRREPAESAQELLRAETARPQTRNAHRAPAPR